jgi:hypothetical protein
MGGMTGDLVVMQCGESLRQDLLDHQFRQGPQQGELSHSPSLPVEVATHALVEIETLVEQAVIVGNSMKRPLACRVKFISNDEAANAPLSYKGEYPEDENRHGPQTKRVVI